MSAEPFSRVSGFAVDDARLMTLFEPWLAERRLAAEAIWSDPQKWVGVCYFGLGDPRLWVPLRQWGGRPSDRIKVPNFSHPRAQRLGKTVALLHIVAAITLAVGIAIALGRVW